MCVHYPPYNDINAWCEYFCVRDNCARAHVCTCSMTARTHCSVSTESTVQFTQYNALALTPKNEEFCHTNDFIFILHMKK